MQTIGYITVNNKNILLLVRQRKYTRALKMRKNGILGFHFEEEELYLNSKENYHLINKLLNGNVINI